MKARFVRRLFLLMSAVMLMLIFSFVISRVFPGEKLEVAQHNPQGLPVNVEAQKQIREKAYRLLGYDKPLFYFTFNSFAVPDSFTRDANPVRRNTLTRLAYYSAQPRLAYDVCKNIENRFGELNPFLISSAEGSVEIAVRSDLAVLNDDPYVKESVRQLNAPSVYQRILKFIPCISFSPDNQFHLWLFGSSGSSMGLIKGDFGRSLISGMPVISLLKFSFCLSFFFALFNLVVSIPAGIFIGVLMAVKRKSAWVNWLGGCFLFIYNIPSFLFAISIVYLFANPDVLDLFPSSGPVLNTSEGLYEWFLSLAYQWQYLVLPLLVLCTSSVIFVAQLVYETLLNELEKPYALTLKAMGYDERYILAHQLLRNTILPIIVTMAGLFPSLISGSMLIDYFFSLNGLGGVLLKASEHHDLPVMVGAFVLVGLVSVFSLYITDYLLKRLDPRVNLESKTEGLE